MSSYPPGGSLWLWVFFALFSCVSFLGLFVVKAESLAWTALSMLGLLSWLFVERRSTNISKSLRNWMLICLACSGVAVGSWAANGFLLEQGRELDTPFVKFLLIPVIVYGLTPSLRRAATQISGGLWICYMVGAALCFLVAYAQSHGWTDVWFVAEGRGRAGGAVNPIYFGNIALLLGFLGLIGGLQLARKKGKRAWSLLGWASLLAGLLASGLSLTRGGWVALPFLLLILIGCAWRQGKKGYMLGVAGVFIVGAVFVQTLMPPGALGERIAVARNELASFNPNSSQNSVGYRLRMWQHAIATTAANPLLGGGPSSYVFDTQGDNPPRFHHAHSDYFNMAANLGLLGLLVQLLLYGYPAYRFLRMCRNSDPRRSELALGGLLIVVGYAFFSLTDVMFYRSIGTVFYLGNVTVLLALVERDAGTKLAGSSSIV